MIIPILMVMMIGIYFMGIPIPNYSFGPLNYLLRVFFHADMMHLVLNMLTLYQLNVLSKMMPEKQLVKMIAFIWVFSSLILYVINSVVPSTKKVTIGFSGILFGMILVMQYMLSNDMFSVSSGLMLSILPQLMIPQISFLGHLGGILSGIMYINI